MRKQNSGLSRYTAPSVRSGTWIVNQIPGVALTKRAGEWQPVVLGSHPQLAEDAARRSEQINQASKLLLGSGMIHRLFPTRQQALQALLASIEQGECL